MSATHLSQAHPVYCLAFVDFELCWGKRVHYKCLIFNSTHPRSYSITNFPYTSKSNVQKQDGQSLYPTSFTLSIDPDDHLASIVPANPSTSPKTSTTPTYTSHPPDTPTSSKTFAATRFQTMRSTFHLITNLLTPKMRMM